MRRLKSEAEGGTVLPPLSKTGEGRGGGSNNPFLREELTPS